jgi:chromosome segregation ATPase
VDRTTSDPESWPPLDRLIYQNNTLREELREINNKLKAFTEAFERRMVFLENSRGSLKSEINTLETRISYLENQGEPWTFTSRVARCEENIQVCENRCALLEKHALDGSIQKES